LSDKLFAIAGLSKLAAIANVSASRSFTRFIKEAISGEISDVDVLDGDGTTEKNTLYVIKHLNRAG